MASRAASSAGNIRRSNISARLMSAFIASASSRFSTSTCARDRRAPFSSKDGFSVVAPTRMIVPSSTLGRNESCCDLLKRWISSTKSSVPRPCSRLIRACSKTFFRSATPEKMAEICSKARPVSPASSRAMVVLPVPGGPQRMIEGMRPAASIRVIRPSGPTR